MVGEVSPRSGVGSPDRCAGAALASCASGEQKAEDQAVVQMKLKLSELENTARASLRSSPDRDHARLSFARELDQHVYASSIDGSAITWSLALVGQGGFSTSGSSTVIRLRTCLQLQSVAGVQLSHTTVTCPARFTKSPDFETTHKEIDLLKK